MEDDKLYAAFNERIEPGISTSVLWLSTKAWLLVTKSSSNMTPRHRSECAVCGVARRVPDWLTSTGVVSLPVAEKPAVVRCQLFHPPATYDI